MKILILFLSFFIFKSLFAERIFYSTNDVTEVGFTCGIKYNILDSKHRDIECIYLNEAINSIAIILYQQAVSKETDICNNLKNAILHLDQVHKRYVKNSSQRVSFEQVHKVGHLMKQCSIAIENLAEKRSMYFEYKFDQCLENHACTSLRDSKTDKLITAVKSYGQDMKKAQKLRLDAQKLLNITP